MTREVHLLAFGNTRSSGPWRQPDIDNSTAGVRRRRDELRCGIVSLSYPAGLSQTGMNGPQDAVRFEQHQLGVRCACRDQMGLWA